MLAKSLHDVESQYPLVIFVPEEAKLGHGFHSLNYIARRMNAKLTILDSKW